MSSEGYPGLEFTMAMNIAREGLLELRRSMFDWALITWEAEGGAVVDAEQETPSVA